MATPVFLHESRRLSSAQARAFIAAFVGWVFDFRSCLADVPDRPDQSRATPLAEPHSLCVPTQLFFLAVGGVISGLLADRYGRRPILMWTIILYTVGTLARAFTYSELWLVGWTAFAALGIGGEYAVGQTLVSEVMPTESAWLVERNTLRRALPGCYGRRVSWRLPGARDRLAMDVRSLFRADSICDLRALLIA